MRLLFKNLFNLNKFYFIKNEDYRRYNNSEYGYNIIPDDILNEFLNELNDTKIKKDKYIGIKTILGVFIAFYFSYSLIKYFK
tara:strand:- start:40 stop:285 length:246 start_codon:yes stop_codon:yes gene_type:complete